MGSPYVKHRLPWPAGKSKWLNPGDVFGHLTVVDLIGGRNPKYACRCTCGSVKNVLGSSLRNGDSRSCGCRIKAVLRERATRHGHGAGNKSSTYRSWMSMRFRCASKSAKFFPHYGARGITVCSRWQKFENFLADMGERPDGTSLDRINNDGGYEPGNCRWADKYQQANNRRTTKLIQRGGERLSITEWARRLGKDPSNFAAMLKRHGIDEAFRRAIGPLPELPPEGRE